MALTNEQKRDAAILDSQGDTPEEIAKHLGVEVKSLPAAIRRKAAPVDETPVDETDDETPVDETDDETPDDESDDDA